MEESGDVGVGACLHEGLLHLIATKLTAELALTSPDLDSRGRGKLPVELALNDEAVC